MLLLLLELDFVNSPPLNFLFCFCFPNFLTSKSVTTKNARSRLLICVTEKWVCCFWYPANVVTKTKVLYAAQNDHIAAHRHNKYVILSIPTLQHLWLYWSQVAWFVKNTWSNMPCRKNSLEKSSHIHEAETVFVSSSYP